MFYNEKEEQRLVAWRQWRESLVSLARDEQDAAVSNLCATIPFGSQHLSYDLIEDWPDPWELVYYNTYDEYSIALIAFYTLALLGTSVQIHVTQTPYGVELLVETENSFLNYPWGSLVNTLPEDCKILKSYTPLDFDLK